MELQVVWEKLVPGLEHHATQIGLADSAPAVGQHVEPISDVFQAFAICYLLMDADLEQFREFLTRSGSAACYFRRKAAAEGLTDDRHLGLSRSEAFFDILVAGRKRLMEQLIALCADVPWNLGWEYEEDYCYHRFLHRLAAERTSHDADAELASILERFEGSLEGMPSARLSVCRGLLHGEQLEFEEALDELIEEKINQDNERRPSRGEWDALFWPRSFVFLEGLALLQLAGLRGMAIDRPFALCPPEARMPVDEEPFHDVFEDLERRLKG